ncbi:MAG: flagellar basal body protein, partial [Pseudothermotoga sp.]
MANLSLFGSLNTALMGVYTHKLAMNVVGHNVANASTDGYSRQRPMIVTTHPLT